MRSDSLNTASGKYGNNPTGAILLPDSDAITISASNSGKIHICPDLTADTTITLPSAEAGLMYEFWYGGTAADAQDWLITTGSNTNFYVGGLVMNDTDDGGDDTAVVDSNGSSNSKLGVLTPFAGTMVKMVCDGVKWYVNGQVVSATNTSVTFGDQ